MLPSPVGLCVSAAAPVAAVRVPSQQRSETACADASRTPPSNGFSVVPHGGSIVRRCGYAVVTARAGYRNVWFRADSPLRRAAERRAGRAGGDGASDDAVVDAQRVRTKQDGRRIPVHPVRGLPAVHDHRLHLEHARASLPQCSREHPRIFVRFVSFVPCHVEKSMPRGRKSEDIAAVSAAHIRCR